MSDENVQEMNVECQGGFFGFFGLFECYVDVTRVYPINPHTCWSLMNR